MRIFRVVEWVMAGGCVQSKKNVHTLSARWGGVREDVVVPPQRIGLDPLG
jgi:hypothetical protein